jgi:hypothetical protein
VFYVPHLYHDNYNYFVINKLYFFCIENLTAARLVKLTHAENSAWYKTVAENNLIEAFNKKEINSTDIAVNFLHYLDGFLKEKYIDTLETQRIFDELKK